MCVLNPRDSRVGFKTLKCCNGRTHAEVSQKQGLNFYKLSHACSQSSQNLIPRFLTFCSTIEFNPYLPLEFLIFYHSIVHIYTYTS